MNVLITGAAGILATALRAHFPDAHYRDRTECDVTNRLNVSETFSVIQPQLVIHCGAVTAHNATPMAYMEANTVGTANVVRQCARWHSRLIYPSTDYLGAKHEDDPVKPVNDYAASKLGGELCVRMLPNSLIVRGSWYAAGQYADFTRAVDDAYTSKFPVVIAAEEIALLALSDVTGIVNIGRERQTMFDIVYPQNEHVARCLRKDLAIGYEYPADTSLDTSRFQALGLT